MSKDYSEDKLIEQTCINLFGQELDWKTINVYQGETFGPNGTLGRNSEADVILKRLFLEAVKRLNEKLPDAAYESAYEELAVVIATKSLAEINFEKYQYLKDGIPVTYKNEKGEIVRNKKIKVFDFINPLNNNFVFIESSFRNDCFFIGSFL